jgi:hypothetical protein
LNIGNQPWVLSRAERGLGVQSDMVVTQSSWLQYSADRVLTREGEPAWRRRWRLLRFMLGALLRYDVLHFYFGQSLFSWGDGPRPARMWFVDLKLAKKFKRKVFMTLQGCDVRMSQRAAESDVSPCQFGNCGNAQRCRAKLDAQRRMFIERILPLVDRVFVLNPDLAKDVSPASFLPYACVDVEAIRLSPPKTQGPIVILHAPSDPSIKGTREVLAAVERLQQRYPIELLQVTGLPHDEAMQIYPRADLVIDQLLCGWYGAFAVEAMAMGKPVACYVRDEDLQVLPAAMKEELPLLRVRPETLEADLEAALMARSQWAEWGRRSREYVLRWHAPARIAQAMVDAYQDPESRFRLHADGR